MINEVWEVGTAKNWTLNLTRIKLYKILLILSRQNYYQTLSEKKKNATKPVQKRNLVGVSHSTQPIAKATMHPHGWSKEDKNHENQNDEWVYKSNIHQDKKRKKQPMNTCWRIEPNSLIQDPISFQWNNCTDMMLKAVSGPPSSIMGT